MNFFDTLHEKLDSLHLLKHPFYQAWNDGTLSLETLKTYAKDYYHHVAAFPRYISSIHSLCPNLQARQTLLGNLVEEEQGPENHPELWQRFAEGLGVSRLEMQEAPERPGVQNLVEGYFSLTRTDYATGLGALYAYERQTPEVAKSKIEGLKKHYGICDPSSLQFFEVHTEADPWHTQEVADLMTNLSLEDQQKAAYGAEQGAQLLWNFLDSLVDETVR